MRDVAITLRRSARRKERVTTRLLKDTKRHFRLVIFRSSRHISAQVIDTRNATTATSASSMEKIIKLPGKSNCNVETARKVGELVSKRASELGITEVFFDRRGYKYHGVVKAFCDSARDHLKF